METFCNDTRAIQQGNWELHGIEISAEAAKIAQESSGAKVKVGKIEEQNYPDNHFDVITA
ncbi:MAG: class I SAM-dependent methyltransferase [Candidatus Hatepunaea meridiana]|nr:class I SAM-dependent methyltransferase [Candidatus Hatepunaea meridiana]